MTENLSQLTIQQIKDLLKTSIIQPDLWSKLAQDPRQGVQKLVRKHQQQQQRQRELQTD